MEFETNGQVFQEFIKVVTRLANAVDSGASDDEYRGEFERVVQEYGAIDLLNILNIGRQFAEVAMGDVRTVAYDNGADELAQEAVEEVPVS